MFAFEVYCMPNPKIETISVIVLTWNRAARLGQCLETLLNQHHGTEADEILVVDDGSTDQTGKIVKKLLAEYPVIKYFRQEHRGIAAARNTGIKNAGGNLIAIVADDYLLPPDYSESIRNFFSFHPEACAVRFRVLPSGKSFTSRLLHLHYETGIRSRLGPESGTIHRNAWEMLKKTFEKLPEIPAGIFLCHHLEAAGGAVFRKEIFAQAGLFDESYPRGEDSEFTRRMRDAGFPVFFDPGVIIQHQHDPSIARWLYKSFVSGRQMYRLKTSGSSCQPNQPAANKKPLSKKFCAVVLLFVNILLKPVWRARQSERAQDFFLFLPFLYLAQIFTETGQMFEMILTARGKAFHDRRKN